MCGDECAGSGGFGDSWLHLCTVAPRPIDAAEQLGIVPNRPLPYGGWGSFPDQYREPGMGSDLPSIGPWQWRRDTQL